MNKGQVSVEYLMLIGFVAAISVPLIIIYYDYLASSNDEVILRQIYVVSQKIVDNAESVYYLGEPSEATFRAYIPNQIKEVTIQNEREIIYKVNTQSGITEIVQYSPINITGNLPKEGGIYHINVKAQEGEVLITYK